MKNLTVLLKRVVTVFCVILLYCSSPATALAATRINTLNQSSPNLTNNNQEGDHAIVDGVKDNSFCQTVAGVGGAVGTIAAGAGLGGAVATGAGLTGAAAVTSGLATLGAVVGGGMIAGLGAVALAPFAVGTIASMAFCHEDTVVVNNNGVIVNGDVNAPQNHK